MRAPASIVTLTLSQRHRRGNRWMILPKVVPPDERLCDPEQHPQLDAVHTLLLDGLSEKEIAARLAISVHTAHAHIKQLYRRAGVNSRAELMAREIRRLRAGAPSPPASDLPPAAAIDAPSVPAEAQRAIDLAMRLVDDARDLLASARQRIV